MPIGAPVLAGLAGLLYALSLFDLDFVLGKGPYWTQPFGDTITHLIGAMYFIRDEWRFPLFFVPQLGFPEGTNIVFTDSLPLLALGAKLLHSVTGWAGNYSGLWLLVCFPLLAFFIAKATREFGGTDVFAMISAALLAVMSPALLARFGHHALMGHFLIAWSIYLYARIRTDPVRGTNILQFSGLAAASLLVHDIFSQWSRFSPRRPWSKR